MPWAVDIDGAEVRLNDLTLASILTVMDGEDATQEVVMQLLAQPLANFPRAVKIVVECAKVAKVDDPQAWVDAYLERSWLDFTKVFVEVPDDLPSMAEDGFPPEGDDGSTAT